MLDFIPFVVEVSAREEFIPPVFSGTPLDRARAEVRRPARALRLVLLFVAVVAAIAAAWVMFSLVRMRMAFYGVAEVGIGSFLFGNLEAIATRENEKSRATAAAIAELREHRDLLVAEAAARAEEEFRAQAADHERQRDIHRLEVELAVIPVEAASDEDHVARRSWELLQRALSASEPRERLGLLKEARRLLPREYRPERF